MAAVGGLVACGGDEVQDALDGPAEGFVRTAGVQKGRQLYSRHGCGLCHGPEGRGDGRIAHTLQPPPRDLADPGQFGHGYGMEEIAEVIRKGVAVDGRQLMPPFGHLSLGDRRNLALYLHSLAEPE